MVQTFIQQNTHDDDLGLILDYLTPKTPNKQISYAAVAIVSFEFTHQEF